MTKTANKIIPSTSETQAGGAGAEILVLPGVLDQPTHSNPKRREMKPLRGRPPGAMNKRTEELRAWILAKYGDPAANLAELGTFTIDQLAQALKCSMLEAAKFYRDVQNDLMPYLHSKMPQAHHVSTVPVAPVTINVPPTPDMSAKTGLVINPINPDTYEDAEPTVAQEGEVESG